ncbi:Protein ALP1-like [Labeo rohita]|uniref:Protein ALP1-like n=1 Tax=Labeo rohita TaxID=84645 RepID=A0ABQ8L8T6_LABRO|nr:Protein ALP1-like [Labeo rohita]
MDYITKIAIITVLYMRRRRRRHRRRHRFWVHPIRRCRGSYGEYHCLVQELRFDEVLFQRYFRLNKTEFDELLARLAPRIAMQNTTFRAAIPPAERLAICLRYLATGDSFTTISYSYRVGVSTEWSNIAAGFLERWNFPNCVGSIDGKHVVIQAPPNSGSMFYNYKGTFSMVLLAVVDANYLFRIIDVGGYGRNSDSGTLANSAFGEALRNGTLDLPHDCALPGSQHCTPLPHVFVGDEAFPLQRHLLRPFPGCNLSREKRIFNYRLSRARLTVECAFGILTSQWRMYRRLLTINPAKAEVCVKATCILHNFLRMPKRGTRNRPCVSSWQKEGSAALQEAPSLGRLGSNNAAHVGISIRDAFSTYFSAEGSVPWQHLVL